MKNSAFLAAVIIAAGGASYGVEAWAADAVPTGASATTAASAPKPCTDGWGFIATDCQLTWRGITVYGTIDAGFGWQSHGAPWDPRSAVAASYLIQKQNNSARFGAAPNALTNSFIGIKGTEPIGGNVSVVFALDAGFDPYSLRFSDGPGSVAANAGVPQNLATAYSDSSRAGQWYNGQGYVGVSSPTYGTLTVFRQNSLTLDAVLDYDPFGGSYGFSPIGFQGITCGGGNTENCRNSTSLKYRVNVGHIPGGGAVAVRRLRPEQCLEWRIPVPSRRRYPDGGQRRALSRRNLQLCQGFRGARTWAGKQRRQWGADTAVLAADAHGDDLRQ